MSITKILRHATRLKNGNGRVKPGQPYSIPKSWTEGEACAQGDLNIIVWYELPNSGYPQKDFGTQLVPGESQGSRHCLDSVDGVTRWYPDAWKPTEDYDLQNGPYLLGDRDFTITHPTHGDVTVPAGMLVECWYQREYDSEQKRERRNAD